MQLVFDQVLERVAAAAQPVVPKDPSSPLEVAVNDRSSAVTVGFNKREDLHKGLEQVACWHNDLLRLVFGHPRAVMALLVCAALAGWMSMQRALLFCIEIGTVPYMFTQATAGQRQLYLLAVVVTEVMSHPFIVLLVIFGYIRLSNNHVSIWVKQLRHFLLRNEWVVVKGQWTVDRASMVLLPVHVFFKSVVRITARCDKGQPDFYWLDQDNMSKFEENINSRTTWLVGPRFMPDNPLSQYNSQGFDQSMTVDPGDYVFVIRSGDGILKHLLAPQNMVGPATAEGFLRIGVASAPPPPPSP